MHYVNNTNKKRRILKFGEVCENRCVDLSVSAQGGRMKPPCGWGCEFKCFQWNSVMEQETPVGNTARQNG